jgi:hypothetical protein
VPDPLAEVHPDILLLGLDAVELGLAPDRR